MKLSLPLSAVSENEVVSLEEVKKTKDAEIEKYKKYLSKAKKIIESFGGSAKSTPEDALEVRERENERERESEREREKMGKEGMRMCWFAGYCLKRRHFGEDFIVIGLFR